MKPITPQYGLCVIKSPSTYSKESLVINLYKRYVFWCFRIMSHVPGYRTYSKVMIRQLERRFWFTTIWNMVLSMGMTVWYLRLLGRVFAKPNASLPDPMDAQDDKPWLTAEMVAADEARFAAMVAKYSPN